MKDNFSKHSDLYSKFRPGYPGELINFLLALVPSKKAAWDCGTGNGQFAIKLTSWFDSVYATDISEAQISNAIIKKNIFYSFEKAEQTSFADNKFDLITIAQAIHWFDFDSFYKEARRTLCPSGIIAAIGYNVFRINKEMDLLVDHFYRDVVGSYWDKERKYVDENYRTIPFPFNEIETPPFVMNYDWEFEHAIGYINTWSAVQHYIKKNNENPVDKFSNEFKKAWGNVVTRKISFPVFIRTGRNVK